MNSQERVRHLFLDKPEGPLYLTSAPRTASPERIANNPTNKPVYTRLPPSSTVRSASITSSPSSTASSYRNSHCSFGGKDSASSAATSVSVPNWRAPPSFVQDIVTQPYIWGYDLPCEFSFLGCDLRFDPAHLVEWISHSVSHFVNQPLPTIAICAFCDEATFRSDGDDATNWRERMLHIFDHLAAFTPSDQMRPDYWVIEHIGKYGIISPEDHAHCLKGTELPQCDNLCSPEYMTPEMLRQKEKDLQQPYDMVKEQRCMKKEKGNNPRKASSSRQPRNSRREVTVKAW